MQIDHKITVQGPNVVLEGDVVINITIKTGLMGINSNTDVGRFLLFDFLQHNITNTCDN